MFYLSMLWHYFPHAYILLMFQNITDDDLVALVSDEVFQPQIVWKLEDVQA